MCVYILCIRGVIRVSFPAPSSERRLEIAKEAKAKIELGKIALRNVRRDLSEKVKSSVKGKDEVTYLLVCTVLSMCTHSFMCFILYF